MEDTTNESREWWAFTPIHGRRYNEIVDLAYQRFKECMSAKKETAG
jgi:hypothetical protein